ncbi:MAG: Ribose-phosphate pyrophosphokinase [Chlamydiales bacterium]|nr:Ribose-phosphate pyrophosphokinase [Chlamydiales bacterium]MCH9619223.1 Ribose-phosphate pyrophosphokinase [Chlamydiales bacterium]MCH9622485.1 Ribose-phosphate pyrophosphokinase [Chlamydiales bacterium]
MEHIAVFSGTSHVKFAQSIADFIDIPLGKVLFQPFPDQEIHIQIQENVRGRDVFVVQSIARNPNHFLMELLIMIDALKRASAKSIVAVIPYFGYSRQDRKDRPRVPITGKLVANLLETAGATRVLTMDLHAGQIQGFFDVPVDNLYGRPALADRVIEEKIENLVIVAPDLGAIKIARAYANHLGAEFAVIDKRRLSSEEVEISSIIGAISGKNVLIVDDMCSTGETIAKAATVIRQRGGEKIYAAFSHGLLVGDAISQLERAPIEKIFTTDTVPLESHSKKIEEVSVSHLFGEAVKRIISTESISSIFTEG